MHALGSAILTAVLPAAIDVHAVHSTAFRTQ